jgi:hypothetical protein
VREEDEEEIDGDGESLTVSEGGGRLSATWP